jgi:hypothetical protein
VPAKIQVFGDSNESSHGRLAQLAQAANEDKRFELIGTRELVSDLRFEMVCYHGEDLMGHEYSISACNVELKDFTGDKNSDFVSSILSGHAAMQLRAMREAREPGMFLVLGTKKELTESVKKAANNRNRPAQYRRCSNAETKIAYAHIIKDFRRNAFSLGIPTFLMGEDPFFNDKGKTGFDMLLQYVWKVLCEGNPFAHLPKYSDDEREIGALIALLDGIGPVRGRAILKDYKLVLAPRCLEIDWKNFNFEDIPGIGPKTAEYIRAEMA